MECFGIIDNFLWRFDKRRIEKEVKFWPKHIRKDIFYGLVVSDPVRFTGINKLCMNQLIWGGNRTSTGLWFKHFSNHF